MAGPDRRPLSEDRDIRPLVRRLHRLPHLPSASAAESSSSTDDVSQEKELVRLEVLKWKAGVERVMASVRNLERQRDTYLKRAAETAARTEALKSTLLEEKSLLSHKLKERDQQLQCDEVANRILARGKTRKELDEQIASLREEINAQQASVMEYQSISRSRIDQWAQIGPIIEQVRSWKLPIDNTPTIDEDKMDVDEVAPLPPATSSSTKLSASAAPFQPSSSSSSSAAPRASTPPTTSNRSASGSSHALPSRPHASRGSPGPSSGPQGTSSSASRSSSNTGGVGGTGRALPSTLPIRPSGLRSSTTTGALSRSSLEEGEVGGEEEGEVSEERSRSSRSGRSRK